MGLLNVQRSVINDNRCGCAGHPGPPGPPGWTQKGDKGESGLAVSEFLSSSIFKIYFKDLSLLGFDNVE